MVRSDGNRSSRRSVLRAGVTLGAVGTVGCVEFAARRIAPPSPLPFGPFESDWPVEKRDPRNTCYSPESTGPEDEPAIVWRYAFAEDALPRAVVRESILAASDGETLRVWHLDGSEYVWTASVDNQYRAPAIDSRHVYVGSAERRLTAYDAATGEER